MIVLELLRSDWWTPAATIVAFVFAAPYVVVTLGRPLEDESTAAVCERLEALDWRGAIDRSAASPALSALLRAIDERRIDESLADRAYRSSAVTIDDARATTILRDRFDRELRAVDRSRRVVRAGALVALVVFAVLLAANALSPSRSWIVLGAASVGAVAVALALGGERNGLTRARAERDRVVGLLVPFATRARHSRHLIVCDYGVSKWSPNVSRTNAGSALQSNPYAHVRESIATSRRLNEGARS